MTKFTKDELRNKLASHWHCDDGMHKNPGECSQAFDQILALIDAQDRLKFKCKMCGETIPLSEVHPYGTGFCHTVPQAVDDGRGGCYPEPSPCGPVGPVDLIDAQGEEQPQTRAIDVMTDIIELHLANTPSWEPFFEKLKSIGVEVEE